MNFLHHPHGAQRLTSIVFEGSQRQDFERAERLLEQARMPHTSLALSCRSRERVLGPGDFSRVCYTILVARRDEYDARRLLNAR